MPLEFTVTKVVREVGESYWTMDPEDIQVLNEYREIFVRRLRSWLGFSSGKRKVCEYCYSLYQFIASCEIQKN